MLHCSDFLSRCQTRNRVPNYGIEPSLMVCDGISTVTIFCLFFVVLLFPSVAPKRSSPKLMDTGIPPTATAQMKDWIQPRRVLPQYPSQDHCARKSNVTSFFLPCAKPRLMPNRITNPSRRESKATLRSRLLCLPRQHLGGGKSIIGLRKNVDYSDNKRYWI